MTNDYLAFKEHQFDHIADEVDRESERKTASKLSEPDPVSDVEPLRSCGPSGGVTRVVNMDHMERMWAAKRRAEAERRKARGGLNSRQVCNLRKEVAAADDSVDEIRRQARKYGVSQHVVKMLMATWDKQP